MKEKMDGKQHFSPFLDVIRGHLPVDTKYVIWFINISTNNSSYLNNTP